MPVQFKFVWICLILVVASVAAGQDLQLEPQRGVLLLRGGQVLQGKITRVGDYFYVVLSSGEIRVRAARVEFFCRSLEEGYQKKRAKIQPGRIDDHLQLADWCLRHGLHGDTANELAQAARIDPSHPRLAILDHRLKFATREPREVHRKSKNQPALNEYPTPKELDRLIAGMSPKTVRTFTQTIQPMLLNHCSTVGCHGPKSNNKFHLLRGPLIQQPTRRFTQRNLYSTLKVIDQDNPTASLLLRVPIRQHGNTKTAVFTDRTSKQYEQLVIWVEHLAGDKRAARSRPASVEQPTTTRLHNPSGGSRKDALKKSLAPPQITSRNKRTHLQKQVSQSPKNVPDPRGSKAPHSKAAYNAKDPFDPEIFNRRFFPEKKKR